MRRELRILARLVLNYRRRYAYGVGALFLTDIGNLAVPWLIGQFIDQVRAHRMDAHAALGYGGAILGISLFVAASRYLWRMNIFGTARMIEFELRDRLFSHLMTLSAGFFQRRTVGDLMAHATNDLQAIRGVVGEGIMAGADSLISVTTVVVAMAGAIDARLTLFSLLPLPILAVFEWRLGRTVHERYKDVQGAFSTLSERVQENLSGMRVIKAFVQEEAAIERFGKDNHHYYERFLAMTRINGLNDPMITLLGGTSALIALGYGGVMVLNGELSLGRFVAFNGYLGMLVWPMLALGWVANLLQRGTASMGRLQALFEEVPEVRDRDTALSPTPFAGRVDIRSLSFRYAPELPDVLSDVSVSLNPGDTLGIIGRTGSGKSTLINLLLRVYDPPEGTVFLDGHDVRDLALKSLREAIGYVPQDSFLFSDTIRANLAFDPMPHDETSIQAAADVASLATEVTGMPLGYETMLGERGITLSGGQRQRVSIARAVLKHASVVVLDDCLSAVDTATEARILEKLRPLMAERTTIIASHRISALQHADRILVLERGRIIEHGSHAELLALGGEYRKLYDRQSLEAAIAQGE